MFEVFPLYIDSLLSLRGILMYRFRNIDVLIFPSELPCLTSRSHRAAPRSVMCDYERKRHGKRSCPYRRSMGQMLFSMASRLLNRSRHRAHDERRPENRVHCHGQHEGVRSHNAKLLRNAFSRRRRCSSYICRLLEPATCGRNSCCVRVRIQIELS